MSGRRVVLYSSGDLMKIAEAARDRSPAERQQAVVAVVMSAVAFEAWFNDLIQLLWDFIVDRTAIEPGFRLNRLHRAVRLYGYLDKNKENARSKVETFHLAMTGQPARFGEPPLQDLELLFKVRNQLVHARPETIDLATPDKKPAGAIIRGLSSRGIPVPPEGDWPNGFLEVAAQPETAIWAVNAAVGAERQIDGLLDDFSSEPGVLAARNMIMPWRIMVV